MKYSGDPKGPKVLGKWEIHQHKRTPFTGRFLADFMGQHLQLKFHLSLIRTGKGWTLIFRTACPSYHSPTSMMMKWRALPGKGQWWRTWEAGPGAIEIIWWTTVPVYLLGVLSISLYCMSWAFFFMITFFRYHSFKAPYPKVCHHDPHQNGNLVDLDCANFQT